MTKYRTTSEYIAAFEKDPTLAALPIPLAASYLGVTSPAITAKLRGGRLEGVQVEHHRLALIRSLVAQTKAREQQIVAVERVLKEKARGGIRSVFYEPIMQPVRLRWEIPHDRRQIGEILGDISRRSKDEQGVLLSVLVHRKSAGTTRPGPGFFKLAGELGYRWKDEVEFVRRETDKVLRAFS